ncbi:cation:proton antiporter [Modestobacter roseus]|uniref:Sodium/proton antiporter (CPA1 family) n=1 Tax=Modestobacter roseus TaxID=1181884 RepID=A0A562INA7_9ACTN|nr:cation:proton antiporter [Modestobacter roseus]MQA32408.1 sodium:proton antiporter [Modestobacter roseus]TWH72326.1 sodium/proton antiporter (CPA1 family) [Modestobacter roseus]
METLVLVVVGLLAIAGATALGARIGVAAPLLLVGAGIAVGALPAVPDIELDPEWILAGVLPPLLYSTAVGMPTMDMRRDFGAISGLSVALVGLTSLLLGVFFAWAVPGLGLAWGIALGAVVSPTDAVATAIAKRLGAPHRVVAVLEGESLLNDATALVLLRTAIAGAAASVTVWEVVGDFLVAVVGATAVGLAVGHAALAVRARVRDVAVSTVLSFTVPFLASVPAEEIGASGLVAAVVAGLVAGHTGPRALSPQQRLADAQNWRTVELVLEGAVFLTMGLQFAGVVTDVRADHAGAGTAVALAAGALLITLAVRALYVVPLLAGLRRRAARGARLKPRFTELHAQLADPAASAPLGRGGRPRSARWLEQARTRLRRGLADIDALLAQPLTWRDGGVVVWAGMRGVVTVAAAQTLPQDTPARSLLVLVAFLVATGSLLLQGGSLPAVVARLGAGRGAAGDGDEAEAARLRTLLSEVAVATPHVGDGRPELAVLRAQRRALLDARDDGTFSAATLTRALAVVDADQIRLELRTGPPARPAPAGAGEWSTGE